MQLVPFHYSVYGLRIESDRRIPELPAWTHPDEAESSAAHESDSGEFVSVRWSDRPAPAPQAWFREWDHDGAPWLRFARVEDGYRLQFEGRASFLVSERGHHVECYGDAEVPAQTVRQLLLDQVLPLLLARKRVPAFHGSAVDLGGRAIAFLGATGAGKSTLAGYFATRGRPLITDDCLALTRTDTGFAVVPAYPGVRLWHDSLEFLGGDEASSQPVATGKPKRRYAATMTFASTPVPLERVYFLEPSKDDRLAITPVDGAESLKHLLASKFLLDSEDPYELKGSLDAAADVARACGCYRLAVPRDYGRLRECAIAISQHAGAAFHTEVICMEFDTKPAWTANPRLATSEIGGEAVILNLSDGNFYGLNDLAAQVWDWLKAPRTVDDLAQLLTSEYEVDHDTARKDVVRLLSELKQRDLIEAA